MRRVLSERFQLLLCRRIVFSIRVGLAMSSTALMSIPTSADAAKSWEEHFRFARAASAYKIQHLGNEAGLPTLADIVAAEWEFTGNTACNQVVPAMSEVGQFQPINDVRVMSAYPSTPDISLRRGER